jgi:hypothetical protein
VYLESRKSTRAHATHFSMVNIYKKVNKLIVKHALFLFLNKHKTILQMIFIIILKCDQIAKTLHVYYTPATCPNKNFKTINVACSIWSKSIHHMDGKLVE